MSKDNYDFVKQHNPEAFSKALAIGSYAHIYAAQIQPSEDPWYEQDHTKFGAQVEKTVMELVADVLRNYHRPDSPGFEPLTEEMHSHIFEIEVCGTCGSAILDKSKDRITFL